MKLLIILTEQKSNEDIAVNPARIVSVKASQGYRLIVMDNGESFEVVQTIEEIEKEANK